MKRPLLIILFVFAATVVLLAVVPPLLPLTSLQLKLERQLQRSLGQPVHMSVLRFHVFPLPAFRLEKLVVGRPAAGALQPLFVSDSATAGLDILALGRGRIAVNKLQFKKPRLAGSLNNADFPPAGLLSLISGITNNQTEKAVPLDIPGSVMDHAALQLPYVLPGSKFTIQITAGNCRLENVPGLTGALQLREVEARYICDPFHAGSSFHGEGACLGGRFGADFYWHRPKEGTEESPAGSLQLDGRFQLVGLLLRNVRLRLSAARTPLDIPYGSGSLELEVNGHPAKGFTIAGQASISDLMIERSLGTAGGKQRLVQNLSADLVAGGYLAVKDDYLNLKNIRLNLPGGATVFSRGLIKYGNHLVLDLLNDVSVPKLEALAARLPALSGIIGAPVGDCSGTINIIGNLASNPIVRLNLSAKHLSLLNPGTGMAAAAAAAGNKTFTGRQGGCSPLTSLERLLVWAMNSDWMTEVHCRVETLDICPASFSAVELSGKKMMNQLVIEKLAGKCGGGDLRLSLVVDDLLHDPYWNTSLVVKKVALEKVLPAWPLSGEADGSLVLGGEAPTPGDDSSAWLESLRGSGTVTVQKGAFKAHRLTSSLFGFSRRLGLIPDDFLGPFSRLRIPLKISAGTCRVKGMKLTAPWYSFQGGGGLDFAGNLSLQGVLLYADPSRSSTSGRPFPHRRRLSAKGSLERLSWQ